MATDKFRWKDNVQYKPEYLEEEVVGIFVIPVISTIHHT